MADPSEVVLRYSPEKWIEANERLGSASPARFVTLNYHPRDRSLPTPTPASEKVVASVGIRKPLQRLHNPSPHFFIREVSQSLQQLNEYGAVPGKPVETAEKDWYYDLANVGQHLRLLRETFKVIQSVRKKAMMGERADFKMLHDFRTSQTGSPVALDDDQYGVPKTEDEDETGLSSAAEVPPPPPPNRRGRPRKKQTRGRKPGPRQTADAPLARTRASRRLQDATLLPLLKERTFAAPAQPEVPEETATNPSLGPLHEPQSTFPILHLPPILPSQRFPGPGPYGYSMPVMPGYNYGSHMDAQAMHGHGHMGQVPTGGIGSHAENRPSNAPELGQAPPPGISPATPSLYPSQATSQAPLLRQPGLVDATGSSQPGHAAPNDSPLQIGLGANVDRNRMEQSANPSLQTAPPGFSGSHVDASRFHAPGGPTLPPLASPALQNSGSSPSQSPSIPAPKLPFKAPILHSNSPVLPSSYLPMSSMNHDQLSRPTSVPERTDSQFPDPDPAKSDDLRPLGQAGANVLRPASHGNAAVPGIRLPPIQWAATNSGYPPLNMIDPRGPASNMGAASPPENAKADQK